MTTELHFVKIVVCCFLHMQEFYPDNYIYGMYVAKILLYVLLKLYLFSLPFVFSDCDPMLFQMMYLRFP